uniref:Uncharacterized protein n=1 Tax=Zea mays TaxID=4577 RepID=C0PAD9_MAIZE|nr:unknown [Zea mays]
MATHRHCLPLLLLVAAALAAVPARAALGGGRGPLLGGWNPIPDVSDSHIQGSGSTRSLDVRVGAGAGEAPEAGRRRAAVPPRGARRAAGRVRDELPPLRRRRRPRRPHRALRRRRVRAGLDPHPPARLLQPGAPRPLKPYAHGWAEATFSVNYVSS